MRKKWTSFQKPIFSLAPMSDVTDSAFRQIIAKYGKPDVFFTEFVSCDGLCSSGKEHLMRDLQFSEEERPIVAQIFGANPEHFYRSALMMRKMGFDGIDINMGCPDLKLCKQGAGASLIREPELAQRIIRETRRGAGVLPVSVKTRIGYARDTLDEWIRALLDAEPDAITVHGRTKKEMSDVPAHWERISRAVEIARDMRSHALILGNGDVSSLEDAHKKVKQYGVDGVMFGRAIFGNPWLFSSACRDISLQEKLRVMLEHTRLFEKLYGVHRPKNMRKNFSVMKKHFKAYASGFNGAKSLRIKLMEADNADTVENIVKIFTDSPA